MSLNKVTVTEIPPGADPQAYEDEHVHAVYEQISSHFSSTRYKVLVPSRMKPANLSNKALARYSEIPEFNTTRAHWLRFWNREWKVPAAGGPFVNDDWIR